ncbi:hypothetical protein ABBQ32_000026 [Trebouxia sp. C0010 RCD-2024]
MVPSNLWSGSLASSGEPATEYEHSELWVVADHLVAVQSMTLLLIPAAQGLEIGTVETSSLLRLRQPDYSCPLDINYDWVGIVGLRTLLSQGWRSGLELR